MARSAASRRWPPITAGAAAAVLALFILPNPFRIPQTNPTATAEFAPVPGAPQDGQGANFGDVNLPTSGGVGSEGQGEGALPGQPPPPIQQFKPRQKDCVGNPPRQTEDPLSPPCVPYFDGDNGGRTFNGVSEDEIRIVFYNDRCCSGDLTDPWKPSDETTDHQSEYERTYIVRTVKALLRYFQRRYQTYGREVRLIGQESTGDLTSTCAQRESDAQTTLADHDPFAVVTFTGEAQCYVEKLAEEGVPSFGMPFDVQRAAYERTRPYVWGFMPDQETEARWSASFICDKLRGETAKYAGDASLRGDERTFGLVYPQNSQRGPGTEQLAKLLIQYVRQDCGMEFDEIDRFDGSGAGAGQNEAPNIMTKYKQRGITTVVCYCVPVQTETTVSSMQNAASNADYHPEWYWDHASAMDRGVWQQTYAAADQPGFGVSYLWRSPAFQEQYHYQAYLSEEPGTQPNVRFVFSIYHLFLNLFQAIQAAGPDLTPETVERGMYTFNFLDRENPWVPVGGYGPYSDDAVSDYTFVDTAMAWWWDPTGTPPGGKQGEGCIRVVRDGLRFYWNEWPKGDGDLFNPDDPCTQDTRKITDPSASGAV